MTWFPLTLLCALSLATSDALTKKALTGRDEVLILWLRFVVSLPFLLGGLCFTPLPAPALGFWTTIATAMPLEILASILYVRALRLSPLSLALPFLAFTPVFLLAVPFVLLGERIAPTGAVGIVLIAIGSYSLNLREIRHGFFAPLLAIYREPGSRLMLAVAFLYSFTSTLGKKAITCSSPLFFGSVYYSLLVLVLAPYALHRGRLDLVPERRWDTLRAAFPPGLSYGVMISSHLVALGLTQVAYMISVKRLSLVFGVLYGHLMFREEGLRERLLGTGIMVAGVALIVWSSV